MNLLFLHEIFRSTCYLFLFCFDSNTQQCVLLKALFSFLVSVSVTSVCNHAIEQGICKHNDSISLLFWEEVNHLCQLTVIWRHYRGINYSNESFTCNLICLYEIPSKPSSFLVCSIWEVLTVVMHRTSHALFLPMGSSPRIKPSSTMLC